MLARYGQWAVKPVQRFRNRAGAISKRSGLARAASRVAQTGIAFVMFAACATVQAHAETRQDLATSGDQAALCDAAAAQASRETGVPLAVLRAISLTETGRRKNGAFRPWPWTVNMEGTGVWFDTEDEARAYVFRHHQRGARSFDVGCFQLNFRWHGQAFSSIEEMFQPLANARYAAGFLSDLYAEMGDWSRAAGAYHSRTPRYANRYRERFDRIIAQLDNAPPPPPPPSDPPPEAPRPDGPTAVAEADTPRPNGFPLLQASAGPTALGSLVPLSSGSGQHLFDARAPLVSFDREDAG